MVGEKLKVAPRVLPDLPSPSVPRPLRNFSIYPGIASSGRPEEYFCRLDYIWEV